jgi:hypothetical protein
MRSFRNLPLFLLVAGFGLARMVAADGDAPKEAAPVKAAAPEADKEKDRLEIPVPKGQPQKGLRIPIYTPEGKLMMNFQIGVASVLDGDNIKMGLLHLQTFKDSGEPEYDIDLTDSIYNQKTQDLTSNVHVRIKRHDFEITGNNVTFNTKTKVGKLGGGVKMVIYNAQSALGEADEKDEAPKIEVTPVKEEEKK